MTRSSRMRRRGYAYDALHPGAADSCSSAPAAQLVTATRVIAAGDALLALSITRRLIGEFARRPNSRPDEMKELTVRELEVVRLVARELSNAEIANQLFVSDATVKTHVDRILMKLLRDRVQAVVAAYESGLVQPGAGGAGAPALDRPGKSP